MSVNTGQRRWNREVIKLDIFFEKEHDLFNLSKKKQTNKNKVPSKNFGRPGGQARQPQKQLINKPTDI
jgi:hypothetical protein